jgi:hypothetical protein
VCVFCFFLSSLASVRPFPFGLPSSLGGVVFMCRERGQGVGGRRGGGREGGREGTYRWKGHQARALTAAWCSAN